MLFEIWERPLELAPALAAVAHAGAGALDVFVGVVRDHNEGRAVSRLEYEAYPAMAVREMQRIADEISADVPGVRLAAIHRVGSLGVGDWAIVCVASAPHRAEAFAACRRLIDQIKSRVPVWKREWGPDGPYWVGWEDARCDAEGHRHGGVERGAHEHVHGHAHGHAPSPAAESPAHQHAHGQAESPAHQHAHGNAEAPAPGHGHGQGQGGGPVAGGHGHGNNGG